MMPTKQFIAQRRRENAQAAGLLTTEGMRVAVRLDSGRSVDTTLVDTPWQLGDGTWVCNAAGVPAAYSCERVTPLNGKGGEA